MLHLMTLVYHGFVDIPICFRVSRGRDPPNDYGVSWACDTPKACCLSRTFDIPNAFGLSWTY